ncbi:hypothetical protein AN1V17_19390 [Vallitalea sediminicola]
MFREKYNHMNEQIYPSTELVNKTISSANSTISRKKQHKLIFRKPIIIVAMLTICIFTTIPILAARVPAVYELMYHLSPNVAQFFIPVQKSCEDNGIKMEVVSTYIHDDTAEIYITMQDLTGNRIDETTDLYDSYSIHRPFNSSATCQLVGYEDTTKTATFLISITAWGNKNITGDKITFSVGEFISDKHIYEDIPIDIVLSTIRVASETKEVEIIGGGGSNFEKFLSNESTTNVLFTSQPMDFPVEGMDFTGIGYVDDMLHIQIGVTNPLNNDNHGFFTLKDKNGNEIKCDYNISFTDTSTDGERIDYIEYMFDIPQAEIEQYSLMGDFVTSGLFTEGNWQVTFPLDSDK